MVTAEEVWDWPEGSLDALVHQGILSPEAPATAVSCDSCPEGHVEQVEVVQAGLGAERRYYIPCPVEGRVQVSAERLRRWRIALPGLAKTMARLLGATGGAREVVRGCMWDLGWVEIGKRVHEVSLVRGLYWPRQGEDSIASSLLSRGGTRIVLSLSEPPQGWSGDRGAASLARLLHLGDGVLSLDDRYFSSFFSTTADSRAREDYSFRRQGEYWVVSYEGKLSILKHSQGFDYIARLLAHPNKEIDALTLAVLGKRSAPTPTASAYQKMSREQLAEHGLSVSGLGDAGDILDEPAKQAYRERLRDIESELREAEENNDPGQTARLQQEKACFMQELSAAVGLGGRGRKAASAPERARTAVRMNIARAVKHIGEHDGQLGQFLDNSIKTGTICVYQPDKEVPWNLDSTETSNP